MQDRVHFLLCHKQSNKIEGVVLNRVCILRLFCPKQGQGFKPSASHLYPNIGRVLFPPPPRPPPGGRKAIATYRDFNISAWKTNFLLMLIKPNSSSSEVVKCRQKLMSSTCPSWVRSLYSTSFLDSNSPHLMSLWHTQRHLV